MILLRGAVIFSLGCPACSESDTPTGSGTRGDASASDAAAASDSPMDEAATIDTRDRATASFFVTSDTSPTGNLGGLAGADARCQSLAAAAGIGGKTWRAYLGAENDPTSGEVHARDRIGSGPWYNVDGELLAEDLDALHARAGDADLFLDENGEKINGQWSGSPSPNQHDILTGTTSDGRVATGSTCADWTSEAADTRAQVGHSDGLGPNQSANPPFDSWSSAHASSGCDDTTPFGGAGKIYCFAAD